MKKLLLVLTILPLVLVACDPPPCGPDCDPEVDAAYDEFQAEEGLSNYEIDRSADQADQYHEDQVEYFEQYDDYGP